MYICTSCWLFFSFWATCFFFFGMGWEVRGVCVFFKLCVERGGMSDSCVRSVRCCCWCGCLSFFQLQRFQPCFCHLCSLYTFVTLLYTGTYVPLLCFRFFVFFFVFGALTDPRTAQQTAVRGIITIYRAHGFVFFSLRSHLKAARFFFFFFLCARWSARFVWSGRRVWRFSFFAPPVFCPVLFAGVQEPAGGRRGRQIRIDQRGKTVCKHPKTKILANLGISICHSFSKHFI